MESIRCVCAIGVILILILFAITIAIRFNAVCRRLFHSSIWAKIRARLIAIDI